MGQLFCSLTKFKMALIFTPGNHINSLLAIKQIMGYRKEFRPSAGIFCFHCFTTGFGAQYTTITFSNLFSTINRPIITNLNNIYPQI